MWKTLPILGLALLANGQRYPTDGSVLPHVPPQAPTPPGVTDPAPPNTALQPRTGAPAGGGAYMGMHLHGNSAGQVPWADVRVYTPQTWGMVGLMQDDTSVVLGNTEVNTDWIQIDQVDLTDIPPGATGCQDNGWSLFNQYRSVTWSNLLWRFSGADSARMFTETAQITSSPPCLFTGVVLQGGKSLKMFLMDCATVRQEDVLANNNAQPPVAAFVPGTGTRKYWQSNFAQRELTIHIPEEFMAALPIYSCGQIGTQVTFGLAQEGPPPPAPTTLVLGPYRAVVNTAFYTSPVVIPISSQFLDFLPFQNGNSRPFTIAGGTVDSYSVTVLLAQPVLAGMRLGIVADAGPQDIQGLAQPPNPTNGAPPLPFPPATKLGLIWANPTTLPANQFFPIGPGCARSPSSVHCCSQSIAEILVPQVSQLLYPRWPLTLAITLGPVGCLLPGNRRFTFVIPKAYCGRLPDELVANAAASSTPGWYAMDLSFWSTAEPWPNQLRRYGGDLRAASYQNGYYMTFTGFTTTPVAPAVVTPQVSDLAFTQLMPAQLPDSVRIPMDIAAMTGSSSSVVVGSSVFRSVVVSIDNNIVGAQPKVVTVAITLNKGLVRLVNNGVAIPNVTPYFFNLFFTSGALRYNVGTIAAPITIAVTAPASCQGAVSGMTNAFGGLLLWITEDRCISSMTQDGSVFTFQILENMLARHSVAGLTVTVDARLVVPYLSVANAARGLISTAFGGLDMAASLANPAWTVVQDCSTMPVMTGTVNDVWAMTPASRCVLVDAIFRLSAVSSAFLQCNPGASVDNAQSLTTFIKYPEGTWRPELYPGTIQAPPVSSFPQQVNLRGSFPIFILNLGVMYSYPMGAVIVSYPATVQSLRSLGGAPVVPAGYTLAFIIRMSRVTESCAVVNEVNPWAFCVVVPRVVVNPLFWPAANPTPGGVPIAMTYGAQTALRLFPGVAPNAAIACFNPDVDGAVAAWLRGVTPVDDDESDGAWYAFFAFFALPLLLLCCCLLALLYFLKKRKTKCCCPAEPQGPVQEMYWVNSQAVPVISAPGFYAPAASPMYVA